MSKRYIFKSFYFAIYVDIVRHAISCFEACREVLSNVDGEECLNVIYERNGMYIHGFSFWNKYYGDFFG